MLNIALKSDLVQFFKVSKNTKFHAAIMICMGVYSKDRHTGIGTKYPILKVACRDIIEMGS